MACSPYGLFKPAAANEMACAMPNGDRSQSDKRTPERLKKLCGPARKQRRRTDGANKRSSSRSLLGSPKIQNPIAQTMPTAGSCMRGFRTPDGTRKPSRLRNVSFPQSLAKTGQSADGPRTAFVVYESLGGVSTGTCNGLCRIACRCENVLDVWEGGSQACTPVTQIYAMTRNGRYQI